MDLYQLALTVSLIYLLRRGGGGGSGVFWDRVGNGAMRIMGNRRYVFLLFVALKGNGDMGTRLFLWLGEREEPACETLSLLDF